MKKSIRRILSGLLCAGVLALGIPAPSRALTLTAVNDSILPLSDSTMPARLGGEVYVPYSVFSQLGVSASCPQTARRSAFPRRRAMSMTRTSTAIPHRPIR